MFVGRESARELLGLERQLTNDSTKSIRPRNAEAIPAVGTRMWLWIIYRGDTLFLLAENHNTRGQETVVGKAQSNGVKAPAQARTRGQVKKEGCRTEQKQANAEAMQAEHGSAFEKNHPRSWKACAPFDRSLQLGLTRSQAHGLTPSSAHSEPEPCHRCMYHGERLTRDFLSPYFLLPPLCLPCVFLIPSPLCLSAHY